MPSSRLGAPSCGRAARTRAKAGLRRRRRLRDQVLPVDFEIVKQGCCITCSSKPGEALLQHVSQLSFLAELARYVALRRRDELTKWSIPRVRPRRTGQR